MNLIMINGPCGVGKSETGSLLKEAIDPSVLISLDTIRDGLLEHAFLADGKPDAVERMWVANVVGRQLARQAFRAGASVIVDAVKYQTGWVRPWEELGHEVGVRVLDICLMAPKKTVLGRADRRGYRPGGRLTRQKAELLYDRVTDFYVDRPQAIIIDTADRAIADVRDQILTYL